MPVEITHHKTPEEVEELGYKGFDKVGGIFRFKAPNGVEIHKTPYGAATLAVCVPDLEGKIKNIVAGFPELSQYEADNTFQGRIVLHANRVRDYQAPGADRMSNLLYNETERKCQLHGGPDGTNQIWTPGGIVDPGSDADPYVVMSWIQPDNYNKRNIYGDGHPGPVNTRLIMRLSEDGTFMQRFVTVSEKTTFRSNTDHIYMMPAGVDSGKSVADMALYNNCTHHIIVDDDLIPTGEKLEEIAKDSPNDFSSLRLVGESGLSLDDCFGRTDGKPITATFYDPEGGIGVEVISNPNSTIQQYMGCGLSGSPLPTNGAGCLEPGVGINGPNEKELCEMLKIDPFVQARTPNTTTITHRYFTRRMPVNPANK